MGRAGACRSLGLAPMVMLTSDLSCMVAGARMQLDELKSKTG
jgi:hypothetical protein